MMKILDDVDFSFAYKMNHIGETPFITELHVEIKGSATDRKTDEYIFDKAGYADLIILNIRNATLAGYNMWEAVDGTSINYIEYGDLLFNRNGEFNEKILKAIEKFFHYRPFYSMEDFMTVAIGERLVIYPEWRGHDATKQLNRELTLTFNFDMLIVKPFPLQHEFKAVKEDSIGYSSDEKDFDTHSRKLKNYYVKHCGMITLPGIKDYLFMFPQIDFDKIAGE